MQIRILKRGDGSGALTCTRHDGSQTWQRQVRHAPFFALHDLTHYAVEVTLGETAAFYGLVASGWEIDDFGPPWPRGPLPSTALHVELLVGLLDAERASGVPATAAEVADAIARYRAQHDIGGEPWPAIDEATLGRIRAMRDGLFAHWRAVDVGAALELTFPPSS